MKNQNNTHQDAEAEDPEADQHNCSYGLSDREDDFMKELPRSTKSMGDAFKSGKSRAPVNDDEVLNDGDICEESHKYLKTQRSSRSSETDHHSCSSDFSEAEAEFRDELHKSTGSRIQMNDFELSDDEETEKDAFMKTHKIHSSSEADLFSYSNEDEEDPVREPLKQTETRAGVFKTRRSRGKTKDFQLSDSFLKTQSIRNHLNGDHQSLSDYFNEDEDEPPKSKKNMIDALKAGNYRATFNDDELLYDQGKSSLKTRRISSPSESDHHPSSSDFSEAEDEFMDELHKSIKHRAEAFKAVNSIIRQKTAVLSDDDDKESFSKAPGTCSPSGVDLYSDSEDDTEKKLLKSTKNRVRKSFKGQKCRARMNYAELSDEEGRKRDSEHHSASEASHYSHSDEDGIHSVEELSKSSINTADVQTAGKSRARMKDFELSDDDGSKEDSFLKHPRTSSAKADNQSCFNEVDDNCVNELLKSRTSKADVLKAGKSRAKNVPVTDINKAHLSIYQSCNDIEPPVDEDTMKQSFLNMQKIHSPSEADVHPDSYEDGYVSVREPRKSKNRVSAFKTRKSRDRIENSEFSDEVAFLEMQRNSSPLEKSSQNVKSDPSIGGHNTIKTRHLSRLDFKLVPLVDGAAEREPPCPTAHVAEKFLEEAITQDPDRSPTPSASSIHSTHTSNPTAVSSCSPRFHQSSEDFNEDSGSHSVHCVAQFAHNQERTSDVRISSSHPEINKIETTKNQPIKSKFQRTCSIKIEPKYLGTLKLLDQKVFQKESEPLTVNLLRAAVYHRWLKMKNEKSRENMQTKKEEEALKKKTEQAKKEAAVASYEAWGKKKASLKAETKQKQVMRRKEQQASRRRKVEKRQSAMREFEKWKQEHDHLQKEKYREEKEAENDLKLKIDEEKFEKTRSAQKAFEKWKKEHDHLQKEKCIKEKEEENNLTLKKQKEWLEKQRNNESNFRKWCEKKQAMTKCKDFKRKKAEEERTREKEERDKKALEAYEDWLARKDLELRREEKLKAANFYH